MTDEELDMVEATATRCVQGARIAGWVVKISVLLGIAFCIACVALGHARTLWCWAGATVVWVTATVGYLVVCHFHNAAKRLEASLDAHIAVLQDRRC